MQGMEFFRGDVGVGGGVRGGTGGVEVEDISGGGGGGRGEEHGEGGFGGSLSFTSCLYLSFLSGGACATVDLMGDLLLRATVCHVPFLHVYT